MLSVIPASILLCCHFVKTCTHHTSLECKCVIMLISASLKLRYRIEELTIVGILEELILKLLTWS